MCREIRSPVFSPECGADIGVGDPPEALSFLSLSKYFAACRSMAGKLQCIANVNVELKLSGIEPDPDSNQPLA